MNDKGETKQKRAAEAPVDKAARKSWIRKAVVGIPVLVISIAAVLMGKRPKA